MNADAAKVFDHYVRALPDGKTLEDMTVADFKKFGKCMKAIGSLSPNKDALIGENEPSALACIARHYPKVPKAEIQLWWKMTRMPPKFLIAASRPTTRVLNMRDLSKSDFTRSEWRTVVSQAALRLALGMDAEHATRWSIEEVYESRWADEQLLSRAH